MEILKVENLTKTYGKGETKVNAVDHSKENSKVDLCVSDNSLYTEICIRDYGVGMNQKDLQNIFTRFYKGENSSSDSIGIGLNIAKNIIEKDNGLLSVDSKKNEGTVFFIKYLH